MNIIDNIVLPIKCLKYVKENTIFFNFKDISETFFIQVIYWQGQYLVKDK